MTLYLKERLKQIVRITIIELRARERGRKLKLLTMGRMEMNELWRVSNWKQEGEGNKSRTIVSIPM